MFQPANDDYSQHLSDDEASYHEEASDSGKILVVEKERKARRIHLTLWQFPRDTSEKISLECRAALQVKVWSILVPYSTYTPTSSNNIQEREVHVGFADEVIYSLFAKQFKDLDLLHEDLEQIDDVDIEEMDINWQIAMIVIRMKKFYKKTGRRVRIDRNKLVGFDKKKIECFKCHNTSHFARECPSKGTNDGKKRDSFYQDQGVGKKEQN
ncbi:ribonuclease H-like domain-containing protein [Tanacetum coccineum]